MDKKNLYTINLITAFSTFAYAVLYSSLSLYFTEVMNFSESKSNCFVGIFMSFNFLLHLFAGYIGGRYITNKNLLGLSLAFQLLGCLILIYLPNKFIGLCFFLFGCGFSVTSLNCLLAEQFETQGTDKREQAFFINYSALNLGFFLGFLVSGYFYSKNDFIMLFYLNTFFSLTSLIIFILTKSYLKSFIKEDSYFFSSQSTKKIILILFLMLLFFLMVIGFYYEEITNQLILIMSLMSIGYILINVKKQYKKNEKNKIYVYLILMLSAIFFWTLYFIGPMGFIFFLKNNVSHTILGYNISPQWFMNFESLLVIIGSPLLAYFFQYLKNKRIYLSVAKKFSIALIMASAAFFSLIAGILNVESSGLVSFSWIAIYYVFLVIGELLIAPVGYAMVANLAPAKLQGVMMGTWLMICGIASILSHHVSNLMNSPTYNPLVTNNNYFLVFSELAMYASVAGSLLFMLSGKIDFFLKEND